MDAPLRLKGCLNFTPNGVILISPGWRETTERNLPVHSFVSLTVSE
jgi:hypothetical protein